ncbi:MAG TPA: PDZ domain-containing protein, partial [Verrucomicrobiae bacterium]|nr:PDZ domain-containing protein [Verrucomicrobiae bacterium]
GVLVPMSPQGQGEVAGAEWYDSGIGFAVPLNEILPHLEKMKTGVDLHPGLIGISMKNGDINADPAIIMGCQPKGPADEAGLKAQDKIVLIDDLPIERQAQLKHALGDKYAGDTVRITVERGGERIVKDVELVEKLEPYQHPLIGILPLRDKSELAGVRVRYVLPASPAAEAGVAAGDRITRLGDTELKDTGTLAEALAAQSVGDKVKITFVRKDAEQSAELTLAALDATIPDKLPPAHGMLAEAKERPNVGVIEIKIPEEKNECIAYVPASYHADAPHALLVALHAPGKFDREKLVAQYKAMCDEHGVILLLPRSAEATRWDNGDAAFIKKAIEDVAGHYTVDRARIAITGYQAAGAMAWLTALTQPETFRGIAVIESPLPGRMQLPEGEPGKRTWFYLAYSSKSPQKSALSATEKKLEEAKLPLVKRDTGAGVRDLTADELGEIGRWLDSLDRL